MNDLSKACLDEAKTSMQTAINFLEKELSKIRASKANPAMLDGVKVDYYGTPTEISQVANINTPDPRNITTSTSLSHGINPLWRTAPNNVP